VRAPARRLSWGLVDQAAVSLTAALVSVGGATLLPTLAFGRLATALAAYYLLLAPFRAVVGETYVVRYARAAPAGASALVQTAAVRLAVGAGGVLALVALAFRDPAARHVLLALAAAVPVLLVQDARRAVLVAAGRTRRSAASSAVVLAGQVAGTVAVRLAGVASAAALLLVWGAAAVLSVATVRVSDTAPAGGGVRAWLAGGRRLWPRFLVEALTVSAAGQLPLLLVAGIGAAAVNAGIRAATLLLAPVYVLQQAVGQLVVAEASRLPARRLRRFATHGSVVFLALAAGWALVVAVLPAGLLRHLVGANLPAARAALPGIATYVGAALVTLPAAGALRASGHVQAAMMVRLALAPLLVGLPVLAALGAATPARVAAGFGAFGVLSTVVWTITAGWMLRDPARAETARVRVGLEPSR
jgi:hypothetical protein